MKIISMLNFDYEHSFNPIGHILCHMNPFRIDPGLTLPGGIAKRLEENIWVESENG